MEGFQFDSKDAEIRSVRKEAYDRIPGPRAGDFINTNEGLLRIGHNRGKFIQTARAGSFYLCEGSCSFSGTYTLNNPINQSTLKDTSEKMDGEFWFFHHGEVGANRGVHFMMACRVYELNQSELNE